jgi:hypothetical protein
MTEGGAVAVQADDAVTGNAEVRRLEERMRELVRQHGPIWYYAVGGIHLRRARRPSRSASPI